MRSVYKQAFIYSFLISILFQSAGPVWALTEQAQDLYKRVSHSVYQIQIIDLRSGEKSAIGSGFRISKNGLFATNYHVVSDVAAKPDRYRIEYHNESGKKGDLTIQALDVTHDLAILKGEATDQTFLSFRNANMSKGIHLFPMGNPLDLGMTIVEGTYNGLVGEIPYERILLSASLNGGMSGGPALDGEGRVVGINVAIEGNALSYLVPAKYLRALVGEAGVQDPGQGWQAIIQDQILQKYNHVVGNILRETWALETFGSLKIPQKISTFDIKCWGKSKSEDLKEEQFYSYGQKWCESQDNIYLSTGFHTGTIGYSFILMNSQSLSPLVFAKKVSEEFSNTDFYPYATQNDVTEFNCENDFIKLAGHDWKTVYCARQYKNYPKLHDAFLTLAVLDGPRRGHVIRVGLAGIDEALARQFLEKFLGGIEWVE